MRTLSRKLVRDVLGTAGTLASVIAIIAVGTGSFIGLGFSHRNLAASQRAYYRTYRFADFWIDVKKAPLGVVEQMATWPGVADVVGRVVFDVIVDLPDQARPIAGRLVSTSETQFGSQVNGLCLLRGTGFSSDRDEEVILSEAFARAHALRIGDRIHLILNRKRQSFVIIGTAISPEYVYMVRGPGDLIPDPEHFGILYVKERFAREVLDFKDACNQVVGQAVSGPGALLDELLDKASRTLEPYGVVDVVPRERQASHRFLSDEIMGLSVSATVMPAIFLGVAALVLNIVMIRLAQRQRLIIGTLKALGYGNGALTAHYLGFAVLVGLLGGLAGVGIGLLLARAMISLYREFFHFPRFVFRIYVDLLATGVGISVLFAVLGAIRGVREALALQPAEAMRPKPPERGGAVFLERFPRIWRRLGFRTQMALRSVLRNRIRTITNVIACALATAIIFLAICSYDAFLYMVDYQFDRVVHSDVDIGMRDEASLRGLWESRELPGVDEAEPVLGVRCDLRHGPAVRRLTVTGLTSDHRLTTPLLQNGERVEMPRRGLVLTRKLAELLGAQPGDSLEMTPIRGRRETRTVHVASVVETFIGLGCYADLRYLSGVVGESLAVNGVQMRVNPTATDALYRGIKQLPNAQGVSVRADARLVIENTLVETSLVSIGLMVIFAGVIAFGSSVSNALIEIGDRLREISTLRVLGYRPGEVAGILGRQAWMSFGVGLVLAFPIGYGLLVVISRAYDSELYRMPVVVRPQTVLLTLVLAAGFMLVAQWVIYRQIRKLDWLEGVKVNE